MSCVRVFSSAKYTPRPADDVLIVGATSDLLTASLDAVLRGQGVEPSDISRLAAAKLKAGQDSGDTITFCVKSGADLKKITLGVLPTACSRMNSPAKPHALSELVKSNKANVIVLVPASADHVFAQVCAVARNFPSFAVKLSGSCTSTGSIRGDSGTATDIVVVFPGGVEDAHLLSMLPLVCENIRVCAHLVDAPTNYLHSDTYVLECTRVHERLTESLRAGGTGASASIEIIKGVDLRTRGFGGIWGVGKASDHLPALVVLSYTPAATAAGAAPLGGGSVCMVGKGIVYDTGGLSIKVPPNMAGMKRDMGGSAAVLCAFDALARSGTCQVPLHALLCIAENAVSNEATRPDDIHVLYSGKTVEVNNTDAEGRLVLSDGVAYCARHLNPAVIMDMATLTGAQLISTGRRFASIYCNDDDLEAVAVRAGKHSGDLVHPAPYCPEFFRAEFKSAVADMKNSVADRSNAQSACAGQFIGNHLEDYLSKGGKWLHIDMAGPVNAGERATGYGVGLLYTVVQALQK